MENIEGLSGGSRLVLALQSQPQIEAQVHFVGRVGEGFQGAAQFSFGAAEKIGLLLGRDLFRFGAAEPGPRNLQPHSFEGQAGLGRKGGIVVAVRAVFAHRL